MGQFYLCKMYIHGHMGRCWRTGAGVNVQSLSENKDFRNFDNAHNEKDNQTNIDTSKSLLACYITRLHLKCMTDVRLFFFLITQNIYFRHYWNNVLDINFIVNQKTVLHIHSCWHQVGWYVFGGEKLCDRH